MQFNSQIFKIYSHINFLTEVVSLDYNQICSQTLAFSKTQMQNPQKKLRMKNRTKEEGEKARSKSFQPLKTIFDMVIFFS